MSDVLLACLFPAMLIYIGFRISAFDKDILRSIWTDFLSLFSRKPVGNASLNGPFSVRTTYATYLRYRQLSLDDLSRMRASYASVGRTHKRIGYDIGYPKKLDTLAELIGKNGKVADGIVACMKRAYEQQMVQSSDMEWLGLGASAIGDTPIDSRCLSRVREALKHFVRDWSAAGTSERSIIFDPILSVIGLTSSSLRAHKRVLVPGSGLGRLAYDITQLGYDVTACELSGYMNAAFRFLLDPESTERVEQHEVHPYAHWWSHSRNKEDLFRGVKFPDVIPRLATDGDVGLHLQEGDFLTLAAPESLNNSLSGTTRGYDYVVTLFFIDTSTNILSTLEKIYALLKPAGIWINLGPLLWCASAQAQLELTLEEVLELVEAVGFVIVGGKDGEDDDEPECTKRRTVPCEYTRDEKAMMRWIYEAEFWVARKV